MVGMIREAPIRSRTARAKLKRGRQPHLVSLVTGRAALGYIHKKGVAAGRWILRRWIEGRYRVIPLGAADDVIDADGDRVLSFEQAEAKARAMLDRPAAVSGRLTVRGAMERYIDYKRDHGQPVADLISRTEAHILPALGDRLVAELTSEQLRKWLTTLSAMPAMTRTKPTAAQAVSQCRGRPRPLSDPCRGNTTHQHR
jgi:hypothetical protein